MERQWIIQKTFLGLYRWYVAESQKKRGWNADLDFDGGQFRSHHSEEAWKVMQGFFAFEQYVPDYVSPITQLVRQCHSRSYFHLQWGAEEAKHSRAWADALIFFRHRTCVWMEEYRRDLMCNEWTLSWDDQLHMFVYTVFQEWATRLDYRNFGLLARGTEAYPIADPILERVCSTLVTNGAAHYHFFLDGVRLYLYYFSSETLEAVLDVLRHFTMPAQNIVPGWNQVAEAIYRIGIYGPHKFRKGVVEVIFANLSLVVRRSMEAGLKASRLVPKESGTLHSTAIWETCAPAQVESHVLRLISRIQRYQHRVGQDAIEPWEFVPDPQWPRRQIGVVGGDDLRVQ